MKTNNYPNWLVPIKTAKIKKTEAILVGGFDSYEESREYLLNKLIKLYENE